MENPPMIGKNIQRIRSSRKLTLNVLSERSGVSKAMLSQIESDKVNPTVATVWKIARGLNVELNDLLDTDDQPKTGVQSQYPPATMPPKSETRDNWSLHPHSQSLEHGRGAGDVPAHLRTSQQARK